MRVSDCKPLNWFGCKFSDFMDMWYMQGIVFTVHALISV